MRMDAKAACKKINDLGILLVFPINNRKAPPSLWSEFYPRKKMDWVWDETGSAGVAALWHLRTELAQSRRVIYTKWFNGRATFFSREVFVALLSFLGVRVDPRLGLSAEARRVLEVLEMDSPLSTKELKRLADLQGRFQEAAYTRALKELWSRLLIVAVGEVEDSSFPSLSIGSTKLLFEDLWAEARKMPEEQARAVVQKVLARDERMVPFEIFYRKLSG